MSAHATLTSRVCANSLIPWTMKFNTCYQIPLLTRAVTTPEFVQHIDDFLVALCSGSTPECPAELLVKSTGELEEACRTDITTSVGGIAALDVVVVGNYKPVTAALCSKNLRWVGGC